MVSFPSLQDTREYKAHEDIQKLQVFNTMTQHSYNKEASSSSAPNLKRKHQSSSKDDPPTKRKQIEERKQSEHRVDNDDDASSGGESENKNTHRPDTKKSKSGNGAPPRMQTHAHAHMYPSVNELKKRIRDVKRLLNRVDLPADLRVVQERALSGYENDLEEETNRRKRSDMIKRYHFVRFLGMLYTPNAFGKKDSID